jgi:2-iminobutanoate/2-iminopropanoate deaminase
MQMTKRAVTSTAAPAPRGGYSQAITAGGLVFLSGQAALDADGNLVGTTMEVQTAKTLDNLEAVLSAAGASLADVVKTTAHISDIGLFDQFDAAYRARMSEPLPARTTVESGLPPGLLVEIDVIAVTNAQ